MLATMMGPELIPAFVLLGIFLFLVPIALALFVFWIWMLISAIQNQGLGQGEKIAWVLVLVFLHWLGAILYFFIGHPKRKVPLVPLVPPLQA